MKKVSFSRIQPILDLPDLLELKKKSFADFLQADIPPEKRKFQGLQTAFLDVFPVSNADDTLSLEFLSYSIDKPRYTIEESRIKDVTYAAPLKAIFRLVQKQPGGKVKEIAEQEVYLCDIPLMTDNATFVINGAERAIVSQLHRSPGVIFEEDEEKKISSYGKKLFFARIIPYRGAWLEFEFDLNNLLYVRIDKKRKLFVTTLLRAIGLENDSDILNIFYGIEEIELKGDFSRYLGKISATEIVDEKTGEIVLEANQELNQELIHRLKEKKVATLKVLIYNPTLNDVAIRNTLLHDPLKSKKEAIQTIYRSQRAQEFIPLEQAESFFENLLFKTTKKYDLTRVGRYKINKKLAHTLKEFEKRKNLPFGWETPNERKRALTKEDIIATIKYLLNLNNNLSGEIDDIDHLGNRRVRAVGELLENQLRIGLLQVARLIRERMNVQERSTLTPRGLINSAPLVAIIRKFFGTSQLSQFMDQTNPLAELTHKRRLSALGPGGLHRKHAGFEVRDVHHTHYGRICPIETPEGPNIGLITSLTTYARVNEYGLLETPYRKVENGKVLDEIVYLTADKEDEYIIAQANAPLDKNNFFATDLVAARYRGDFPLVSPKKVNYMDISPMQIVSVSTALIPFLEHDDANRALMGSNMQRQAVPILHTEVPLVSTGIESRVARDSGALIIAKRSGEVLRVTADEIFIWSEEGNPGIDIYKLRKYQRSNQDSCINQIPLVKKGDKVKKDEVIADGVCTNNGELALGKNLLVAFLPWEGYNFEDAILVSERVVKDDIFTSVHIQEFRIEARDTKMGPEEITRDIPNVGADDLINLDENGLIRIGAEVRPGDILVGKVTPKGEQAVTPEERLLKVIFGKKAEDVQDASLRVPPGVKGKVIGIRLFVRQEKLTKKEKDKGLEEIENKYEKEIENLRLERKEKIENCREQTEKEKIRQLYLEKEQELKYKLTKEKETLKFGDELPVTINKIVKVYIASLKKMQVGDKLAGRHGNKGVIAKILAEEDMPFLPDGTPVDVVFSPLCVPSRMNIGQLLESMLGWSAKVLNVQMISPVFNGAKENEIKEKVKEAKEELRQRGIREEYLPTEDCRITLYDGRTGEPFAGKVTIGYMYLIKLIHLVEDKIHARSTGPYSLITRQPLGGKAQFGGQRFGEMEVWALEGYGAAHTLQEFLTVKSDDVPGRTKMYETIIKGEPISYRGVPESFKVLVRELQGLGLNIELKKGE
jgi:DNA-directed RNA polymerase subunit beta